MDQKAKNILFRTYWKNGWIDSKERFTDPTDFEYAKSKGLMFEKLTISHDDCIKRIIELVNKITIEEITKAFLSSLSTRRLDWRSGIASYFIAKLFKQHKYTPTVSGHSYVNEETVYTFYTCEICKNLKYGVIGAEFYKEEDLNVLNFERIKWGGVRHGELVYTFFDLEQFSKEKISEPTKEDINIFKEILKVINSSQKDDYPSTLREKLKDIPTFKSNKNERSIILEILACIEILQPTSYDRPIASKNDWTYIEYWRGEDKYNKKAVNKYFGKYLS